MSACRSCGAPIIWALTKAGRRMPLDAEPVPFGRWELVASADAEGKHVQVAIHRPQGSLLDEPLYQPHWASCNEPGRWRQAKP